MNTLFHFPGAWNFSRSGFQVSMLMSLTGFTQHGKNLAVEWATIYNDELKEMWDCQVFRKLPPLD